MTTLGGEPQPANRAFAKEVNALFEHGIQAAPYAWHGTNVPAILHLAEHGRLPASNTFGPTFYYAPEHLAPGSQQDHATHWANLSASRISVREQLPFEVPDQLSFMFAMNDKETMDELAATAAAYKITRDGLWRMFARAERSEKGVLLGISPRISTDYAEQGNEPDERYVETGQGLPIGYITGIEPLGNKEWDALADLFDIVEL